MYFTKTIIAFSMAMTSVLGLVIERQTAASVAITFIEPEDSQVVAIACVSTVDGAAKYIAQAAAKYNCKSNVAAGVAATYQCSSEQGLASMAESLSEGKGKFTCE